MPAWVVVSAPSVLTDSDLIATAELESAGVDLPEVAADGNGAERDAARGDGADIGQAVAIGRVGVIRDELLRRDVKETPVAGEAVPAGWESCVRSIFCNCCEPIVRDGGRARVRGAAGERKNVPERGIIDRPAGRRGEERLREVDGDEVAIDVLILEVDAVRQQHGGGDAALERLDAALPQPVASGQRTLRRGEADGRGRRSGGEELAPEAGEERRPGLHVGEKRKRIRG